MAISIGRALASALSGTAKGLAKGAVAADERRDKYTQVALAAGIKKAQELEDQRLKDEAEAAEEASGVKRIMNTSIDGRMFTKAEATEIYRQGKALGKDAAYVLENYAIKSENGGILKPAEAKKRSVLPSLEGIAADTSGGFLGVSDTEGVAEDARELLKASGYETTLEMPTKATVEGVTLELKNAKYKGFKYITYTVTDDNGKVRKGVPGLFNPEKGAEGRLIWDVEKNDYAAAPAKAIPEPKTTRQLSGEEDASEVYGSLIPEILKVDKKFPDLLGAHSTKVEGAQNVMDGLERMSKYALNDQNYSVLANTMGTISRGIKNEIAGISFTFANDTVSEEDAYNADTLGIRNADGTVNQARATAVFNTLGRRMEELDALSKAEGISRAQDIMAIQALRLAVAELVTDGDARPSDFDVQSRIKGYLANSPEKFIELAEEKIAQLQSQLENSRNKIKVNSVYTSVNGLKNDKRTSENAKAALDMYMISTIQPVLNQQITLPSFMEDGFDKSQFSDTKIDPSKPIIEIVGEGEKARKRVIMEDGSYLKDGGVVLDIPLSYTDEDIQTLIKKLGEKNKG